MPPNLNPNTRRTVIQVYVTAAEKETIDARSRATGLSSSTYARRTLLEAAPVRTDRQDATLALLKTNADMARLGNLFRLAIDEGFETVPTGYGEPPMSVSELLEAIEETRSEIKRLARAL